MNLLDKRVGARLSRLDLHYVISDELGLNVAEILIKCPNLEELAICDSKVVWLPKHGTFRVSSFLMKNQYTKNIF